MKQPINKFKIEYTGNEVSEIDKIVITLTEKINELIERVNELYDNCK